MASASVVYVYALVLLLVGRGARPTERKSRSSSSSRKTNQGATTTRYRCDEPGAAMAGLENLTLTALQAAPLAALEGTGDGGGIVLARQAPALVPSIGCDWSLSRSSWTT